MMFGLREPATRTALLASLIAALAHGCADGAAPGEDWPQFLGPNRDGRVTMVIRRELPATGPPVLWRRPVGAGYASVSVTGGTVYLFHRVGNEEIVEALDAGTGETRWATAHPTDYRDDRFGFDEGPRAAPTVRDGVVYTAGVQRFVQALDAATGERIWGVDAIERFSTRRSPFGNATQPFLVDGKLVLNVGGAEAGIVALDAATGDTVWTATDHEAAYAPPLLAEIGGQQHLFFFTREGLVDLEPATGTVQRMFPWRARSLASVNAAMPVRVGDRIFLSASYKTGAAMLELVPDGFSTVWTIDRSLSNHYVTSIYRDGVIYGMHGRQPANPSLRAIDAATGEVLWGERGLGTGSLLLAGDTLVFMRETGELTLLEATGEEYRELATADLMDGEVRAYPALARGVLYVRDHSELKAVDLRPR
jgi:outer membrane protein assembly factor BamB